MITHSLRRKKHSVSKMIRVRENDELDLRAAKKKRRGARVLNLDVLAMQLFPFASRVQPYGMKQDADIPILTEELQEMLPDILINEISVYLDAYSLKMCEYVSKSWNQAFNDALLAVKNILELNFVSPVLLDGSEPLRIATVLHTRLLQLWHLEENTYLLLFENNEEIQVQILDATRKITKYIKEMLIKVREYPKIFKWELLTFSRDNSVLSESFSVILKANALFFQKKRSEFTCFAPLFIRDNLVGEDPIPLPGRFRNYPTFKMPRIALSEPLSGLLDYQRSGVQWMLRIEEMVDAGEAISFTSAIKLASNFEKRISCLPSIRKNGSFDLENSKFVDIDRCDEDLHVGFKGGVLGDKVGMGKTLQILSLIASNRVRDGAYLDSGQDNPKTSLLICPGHILEQWKSEAEKFYPNLNVAILRDMATHQSLSSERLDQLDLLIVSKRFILTGYYPQCFTDLEKGKNLNVAGAYSLIESEKAQPGFALLRLTSRQWRRLIVDEAHEVLLRPSIFTYVRNINSKYKWWVSGTPFASKAALKRALIFLELSASCRGFNLAYTREDELKHASAQKGSGYTRALVDSISQFPRPTVANYRKITYKRNIDHLLLKKIYGALMNHLSRMGDENRIPQMDKEVIYSSISNKFLLGRFETVKNELKCYFRGTLQEDHLGMRIVLDSSGIATKKIASEMNIAFSSLTPYNQSRMRRFGDMRSLEVFFLHHAPNVKRIFDSLIFIIREGHASLETRIICPKKLVSAGILHSYAPFCLRTILEAIQTYGYQVEAFRTTFREITLQTSVITKLPKLLKGQYLGILSTKRLNDSKLLYHAYIGLVGPSLGTLAYYITQKLQEPSSRLIVFSWSNFSINELAKVLEWARIPFVTSRGSHKKKGSNYVKFNTDGSQVRVILMSRRNASAGVTLNRATHILFVEKEVNETSFNYIQCLGRAHRYGQKRNLRVVVFDHLNEYTAIRGWY